MIEPTVGRVVWYHPGAGDGIAHSGGEPLASIVARVWSDTEVNLMVIDANGQPFPRKSVLLVQEGSPAPDPRGSYCEWMPYQKGQAAKTEALEARVTGAR